MCCLHHPASTVNLKGATSSNHLGFGWNKHPDWKLAACNLNWIFTVRVPAPCFWGAITPTDWPRPITARHVGRTCPGSAPHWVEPSTLVDRSQGAGARARDNSKAPHLVGNSSPSATEIENRKKLPSGASKLSQMQPTMLCHSGIYQAWPNLWETFAKSGTSIRMVSSEMPQLTLIFATCCAS